MATAKATVTRTPVTTYVDSKVITLELTEREAETLRFVVGLCGGPPESRHEDSQAINAALSVAGIPWLCRRSSVMTSLPDPETIAASGYIYFD